MQNFRAFHLYLFIPPKNITYFSTCFSSCLSSLKSPFSAACGLKERAARTTFLLAWWPKSTRCCECICPCSREGDDFIFVREAEGKKLSRQWLSPFIRPDSKSGWGKGKGTSSSPRRVTPAQQGRWSGPEAGLFYM